MKKNRIVSILLCMILLCSCISLAVPAMASGEASGVIARAKQGVVQLYTYATFYQDGGHYYTGAVGTGFAVGEKDKDSNVFVTNRHVITMEEEFDPNEVRIWLLFDGCTFDGNGIPDPTKSMECDLVTISPGYPDYAILRAKSNVSGYRSLPLRKADNCSDGSTVYALGYPAIVREMSVSKFGIDDMTVTNGIVSKHMEMAHRGNTKSILHTAQISGGNSGGPLIDENGAVIGINTYGFGEEVADHSVAIYSDYIIDALKAQDLPYYEYSGGISNTVLYICIGVGATVILALVIVLVSKKKKSSPAVASNYVGMNPPVNPPAPPTQFAAYRLRCSDGTSYTVSGSMTTVGRDSSCQIRLPESAAKVSRRHCTLEISNGTLVLTDIGSSNGTFIHGKRVPANTRIALKEGSQFSLGSSDVTFTVTR